MARMFAESPRANRIAALVALAALALASNFGCARNQEDGKKNQVDERLKAGAQALENEEWARAFDAFADAIDADPQNADAFYGRAAAASAQAEEHYRLAQAAATNQDVEKGREEAEKADQFFARVVEDCNAAIKINPNYADAYFLKGVAAQYQAAWDDGIEAFTQCVKLDPQRGEAFHRRAEIYDHVGDYMNSSVDFKKAAELGFVKKDEKSQEAIDEDFSDLKYDPEEEKSNDENK